MSDFTTHFQNAIRQHQDNILRPLDTRTPVQTDSTQDISLDSPMHRVPNLVIEHADFLRSEQNQANPLTDIPQPAPGALENLFKMTREDVQHALSTTPTIPTFPIDTELMMNVLITESEDIQSESIAQDIETQAESIQNARDQKLLEIKEQQINDIQQNSKCEQQAAKICICIPGIPMLVGAALFTKQAVDETKVKGLEKAMIQQSFGQNSQAVLDFIENYEEEASKELALGIGDKNALREQVKKLYASGAIDRVKTFELNQLITHNLADASPLKFEEGHDVGQIFRDIALGKQTLLFPPEKYPEGLLDGYTIESQSVPEPEQNGEWLREFAESLEEVEEQDQALSNLVADMQEVRTTVQETLSDNDQLNSNQHHMI